MATKEEEDRRSKELMARLRKKNRSALGALYEIHAQRVLRVAMRYLEGEDESVIDDVSQQVWCDLIDGSADYVETEAPFECWLLVFARNRCKDARRKKQTFKRREGKLPLGLELPGGETLTTDHLDDPVVRAKIERAIGTLPALHRQALELTFFEDKCAAEVARARGESERTMRARVQAALGMVKAWLEKNERGE